MNPVEQYLFDQKEPFQSIMLYVRSVILKTFPEVEEKFKYKPEFDYFYLSQFIEFSLDEAWL